METLLCSNCFNDQGLKIDSFRIGIEENSCCPNCKTNNGKKLNQELINQLAERFFVTGSFHKCEYGGAPTIQFNSYQKTSIDVSEWLKKDLKLIENSIGVGFFYYSPRLWMIGEVEPLKYLQKKKTRHNIILRIMKEYSERIFGTDETFYRLRKVPLNPSDIGEYDSPPNLLCGKGRLDSKTLPIMYGSQDLDVCIHECRTTVEDEIFVATLVPTRKLRLLDLTKVLDENNTEFESLDIAVHMLFLAGKHSYYISRDIALAVYNAGFDGIIYPSFFSLIRTGGKYIQTDYGLSIRKISQHKEFAKTQVVENIALFGRPIRKGDVEVKCINRIITNRIIYDFHFGPIKI